MPWRSGQDVGIAAPDDSHLMHESHDPNANQLAQVGADHALHPTKARVSRGLQDLLIDLKEMKADNRRLEDLLRGEQAERQSESAEYMRARQSSELQIKNMEDEMRQCLQELKWSQLELKRAITTAHEATRAQSSLAGPEMHPDEAIGWNMSGELMIDDEGNPAKQVHNNIKLLNDLCKRSKEEVQNLVGISADLKWEKAKAEVTAKAYCTELLTCKKNNATKKMRAQLCRWRHLRIAKGFSTWVYWHTALAKEMVRRKRTLLEEDVIMLSSERDRLAHNLDIVTGQKEAHSTRSQMLEELLTQAGISVKHGAQSSPEPGGAPGGEDFQEVAAKRIQDMQGAQAAKKLVTHFKYQNFVLRTRVFIGWANHIRSIDQERTSSFIRSEQKRAADADKTAQQEGKRLEGLCGETKAVQEEGKVRYYQAAMRRDYMRRMFATWTEVLFQSRIRRTEELLQIEFEQRVHSEQSRHDLERELEEIYLSKARAEAEREEAMGALRNHREKEELDMNRLLEEVGYLKAEVYAS